MAGISRSAIRAFTGKDPSDKEEGDPDEKTNGVMIPESVLDEFVVMRLAEMI